MSQYGKQNPLFMYQGTEGRTVEAALNYANGGETAAQSYTVTPSQCGASLCGTLP